MEGDLRLYARYGITTVNSLETSPRGGAGPGRRRTPRTSTAHACTSPARSSRRRTPRRPPPPVAANAEAGVDWIKIRVDDNLGTTHKLPWPVVETVMREAGARGFRVATHIFYLDDAKRLLRMGSDLIAHSVRDADVDAELVSLLEARDVCYVPTLVREVSTYVYGERPAFFDDPFFMAHAKASEVARVSNPTFMRQTAASPAAARYRTALVQAKKNLKSLEDAGVRVAMGTDSGPAGRFPGYFEHMELRLMVQAGLTPQQALLSATSVAASCLGLDDVGTLVPGRWADFLVLGADPLADIANTETLEAAYVAGNEVR